MISPCDAVPASLSCLNLEKPDVAHAAGPNTGLGLENMRHVISIHDVVSDTMHQFAPTYHNYVLYSNQGSKEAPKTVSMPFWPAARLGQGSPGLISWRLLRRIRSEAMLPARKDCLSKMLALTAYKWRKALGSTEAVSGAAGAGEDIRGGGA